jgi:hypothetical protein
MVTFVADADAAVAPTTTTTTTAISIESCWFAVGTVFADKRAVLTRVLLGVDTGITRYVAIVRVFSRLSSVRRRD